MDKYSVITPIWAAICLVLIRCGETFLHVQQCMEELMVTWEGQCLLPGR